MLARRLAAAEPPQEDGVQDARHDGSGPAPGAPEDEPDLMTDSRG